MYRCLVNNKLNNMKTKQNKIQRKYQSVSVVKLNVEQFP